MKSFVVLCEVMGILAGCTDKAKTDLPAGAPPSPMQKAAAVATTLDTNAVRWAEEAAGCGELCARLAECKLGLESRQDCVDACESAEDDEVTAGAYSCRYQAKSCAAMKACDN